MTILVPIGQNVRKGKFDSQKFKNPPFLKIVEVKVTEATCYLFEIVCQISGNGARIYPCKQCRVYSNLRRRSKLGGNEEFKTLNYVQLANIRTSLKVAT